VGAAERRKKVIKRESNWPGSSRLILPELCTIPFAGVRSLKPGHAEDKFRCKLSALFGQSSRSNADSALP
jgi:hypothetical protein